MADFITLTGVIATDPRHIVTSEGLAITSFRLASNQRVYDRKQQDWVDKNTNWYTITAFRQLATHISQSCYKGEHVIVHGRLKIREWESGESAGLSIEVEADSLGHNLLWGTSEFTRRSNPTSDNTSKESNHTEEDSMVEDQEKIPAVSGWGVHT